ncbi:hypothetical protein RvY_08439-4 [Ramazzottius varieornatus]|uniref:Uncharacterized protein n=1 Tax=Ramazzottius varieornatus TaxID=947166 RepID=A0A1D1VDX2_RAMVA|nr:hypothetical protein RvY_08439-4 [Ramazzottius varieornatus]
MDGFDSYDRPGESQSEPVLKIVILGEPGVGKVRFYSIRSAVQLGSVLPRTVSGTYRPHKNLRRFFVELPDPKVLRRSFQLRLDPDERRGVPQETFNFSRSCGRQSAHLGHWWIGHAGKPNAEKLPS